MNGKVLTRAKEADILKGEDCESSREAQALAEMEGRLARLAAEMRASHLKQVAALEDFLGIDCRTCKHCGRNVR